MTNLRVLQLLPLLMRFGSCGEPKLTSRLGNEITAVYPDLPGVCSPTR